MSIEQRARMYEALGHPYRLLIADTLLPGDLSFSEIVAVTELPGNVLAHHLGVLERAGAISRRVSEGDARRRYVALTRAAAGVLGGVDVAVPSAPLFVCTHNAARSRFAETVWNMRTGGDLAGSAGLEPADRVNPRAVAVAADMGVEMSLDPPRGYGAVTTEPSLVISVCDRAAEGSSPFPVPHRHWSIPDPVRSSDPDSFRAAFDEITARIERLLRAEASR